MHTLPLVKAGQTAPDTLTTFKWGSMVFLINRVRTMRSFLLGSMPVSAKIFLTLGALSACSSVVFSAAFAHLPVFAGGVPVMVQTALNQQQLHSLGLLVLGLAIFRLGTSRWLLASAWMMVLGLLFFSFNIYARQVWGFDALRAFVPWGGGAWIAAWLLAAVGFARH
jgi:uncharacterized membrane protein YgdD (TMEM256/DUF423 family)